MDMTSMTYMQQQDPNLIYMLKRILDVVIAFNVGVIDNMKYEWSLPFYLDEDNKHVIIMALKEYTHEILDKAITISKLSIDITSNNFEQTLEFHIAK